MISIKQVIFALCCILNLIYTCFNWLSRHHSSRGRGAPHCYYLVEVEVQVYCLASIDTWDLATTCYYHVGMRVLAFHVVSTETLMEEVLFQPDNGKVLTLPPSSLLQYHSRRKVEGHIVTAECGCMFRLLTWSSLTL